MKLHIVPTYDRVVVIADPIETMTEGGLHKVPSGVELPLTGTVYAVGPGLGDAPLPFVKGDRVVFGAYSGTPLPVASGIPLIIFRASDLLCKVIEEKEPGDDEPAAAAAPTLELVES